MSLTLTPLRDQLIHRVRRALITARIGRFVGRELDHGRGLRACGDTEPKIVKIRRDGGSQQPRDGWLGTWSVSEVERAVT